MRAAFVSAILIAGVLAAPHKRDFDDWEIDTEVVYVTATAYTTVVDYQSQSQDGFSEPSTTADASTTESSHSRHYWHTSSSASVAPAPIETSSPPYIPPAPSSESSSSIWIAPSSTLPPSSPSSASASSGPSPSNYQDYVVVHHNLHRQNHSAPAIQWNSSLASTAQKIANTCNYAHSMNVDGGGYGQNIAAGVADTNVSLIISNMFYNGEVNYYNGLYGQAQPDMTNFEHWGHFSQIVWADTVSVACVTKDCGSGGLSNVGSNTPPYFTVCNYYPPGNVQGEYTKVGKSLNLPTKTWADNS